MSLKKNRALTLLTNWLNAVEIPYKVLDGTVHDLQIIGKSDVFIKFTNKLSNSPDKVLASSITASLKDGLNMFWILTKRAGYKKMHPCNRGSIPADRKSYKDNTELVAMRHMEFRRSPNLSNEVYLDDENQKIMKWFCAKFYRMNISLCQRTGYEIDDLMSYAMIYLTNFHGMWNHMDKDKKNNNKMFCSYLNQRFYSDLKPILEKRSKNMVLDEDTISAASGVEFLNQSIDNRNFKDPVSIQDHGFDLSEFSPIELENRLKKIISSNFPKSVKAEAKKMLATL